MSWFNWYKSEPKSLSITILIIMMELLVLENLTLLDLKLRGLNFDSQ